MRVPTHATFISACILAGCSSLPSTDEYHSQLQAKLRTVVIEDGISQQEADVIAESYFLRFTPIACGSVARPIDGDTVWIAKTYFGIAPMPTREPIRIDKRTGRVTWSDGPTIENPMTISGGGTTNGHGLRPR
jgi:hypothetical protein